MRAARVVLAASGTLLAAPACASACTWCTASAFGDRTFNWPYLSLILAPFIVAVVIGVVLARSFGVELRALLGLHRGRPAPAGEPAPIKETT